MVVQSCHQVGHRENGVVPHYSRHGAGMTCRPMAMHGLMSCAPPNPGHNADGNALADHRWPLLDVKLQPGSDAIQVNERNPGSYLLDIGTDGRKVLSQQALRLAVLPCHIRLI